ncbi:MAG TPA: hypothetical protein VML19_28625 [Verrucomicrobiae bacterium]|nr:hypothetical protein [Verrucomicrobiae bacterium]
MNHGYGYLPRAAAAFAMLAGGLFGADVTVSAPQGSRPSGCF